ncbi:MAG: T9SS type A sorting domain-containing protein [Saprospiraceae bacterium]
MKPTVRFLESKLLLLILILGTTLPLAGQRCYQSDIQVKGGGQFARLCPTDGASDIVRLTTSDSSGLFYSYILVNLQDEIIFARRDSSYELDYLANGTYRFWGVSHSDTLVWTAGLDVTTVSAKHDGCVNLSNTVVTVYKDVPDAGEISLRSGIRDTVYCSSLSTNDTIQVKVSQQSNLFYTFVLVNANGVLLAMNPDGMFDLRGQPDGFFQIIGVSYSGIINVIPGDIFGENSIIGCHDYSIPVSVTKSTPTAGLLRFTTLDTMATVCPADGNPDWLIIRKSANSNSFKYGYLVTDEHGVLTRFSAKDSINFENSALGTSRIYGLSYSGDVVVSPGDSIWSADSLTTGCWDLTESYLTVHSVEPKAGRIRALNQDSILYACPGDNLPDRFFFDSVGATLNAIRYVVTDEKNVITRVLTTNFTDFEATGFGTARVYSISFIGEYVANVGDTLFVTNLVNGCYDISENYLTVIKEIPQGGRVTMMEGDTILYLCNNSVGNVVYRFKNNSPKPLRYDYVLTNEINQIIDIANDNSYVFTDIPRGEIRIWGVAYSGNRLLDVGDNIIVSSYSDACFDVSDNYIRVIKDVPFAGQIALTDGTRGKFFCLNDAGPATVQFINSGSSNSRFTFAITDESDKIVKISTNKSFDLKSMPVGGYRIYGVSYTGDILVKVGDLLQSKAFSNDCFDVSDQFIHVIRDNPYAGRIQALGGSARVFTCPLNDNLDFVHFQNPDAVSIQYAYVVTDTFDNITQFTYLDSIDFGFSQPGKCRVYGVGFEGTWRARVGNNIRSIAFSDGCYDLTNNYVEIIKRDPPNINISSPAGDSITICVNDDQEDLITFTSDDVTGIPVGYVITDLNSRIIGTSLANPVAFNDLPPGDSRVYGVAFTGEWIARTGNFLLDRPLSDDCYTISNNFIKVNKQNSGERCVTVAVHEPERAKQVVRIHPNPTSGQLELNLLDPALKDDLTRIEVLDILGRALQSWSWQKGDGRLRLDLSAFPPGNYWLRLESHRNTWVMKVQVIR